MGTKSCLNQVKAKTMSICRFIQPTAISVCLVLGSFFVSCSSDVLAQDAAKTKVGSDEDAFTKVIPSPTDASTKPDPQSAQPKSMPVKIDFPANDWSVLHLMKKPNAKPRLLSKDSRLSVLHSLKLTGAGLGNSYLLGEFSSESSWYIDKGYLQPVEKTDSALRIGAVEDFELQGIWSAEGLGGWYILLGWNNGHGYALENVTFVSSGSPWHIAEHRGGMGIKNSHVEVCRFDWKGNQPFRLTVKNKQLSMQIGNKKLINGHNLANYAAGDLIVGTYHGRFEPKPLKIRSLRIKSLTK